jgi:membrane protease YdiL (CAAX protease family)
VRPPALPQEPVGYHHVLRGPRRRWWRPLLSLLLVIAGILAASIALVIVSGIGYAIMSGGDLDAFEEMALDFDNPLTFAVQNLWLAALIPIACLATWIAHGVRPGFVSSVVGRFRWGWFGWCLLVVVPLWIAYLGIAALIDGADVTDTAGRPSSWAVLLILTFLTTPLQAAGEEYLFRGWLMQQIGVWVKNTYAALTLAVLLSSVVFALAHTSLDPWILIDLGAFATAAVLLTWRTGGLEAAVALHVVNNILVLVLSILTTGLQDAFITSDTTSDPVTAVISVTALTITSSVIWWLAGRRGVARTTAPAGEVARVPATV